MKQYDEIIIFGANGWLGKNLLDQFDLEIKKDKHSSLIAVVEQENQKIELKDFKKSISRIINADITNIKELDFLKKNNGDRLIIHCASVIHPKNIKQFYKVNYFGTKNIIDMSKHSSANTTFLYISSNSPFGLNKSNQASDTFDEQSEYRPYMKYGFTKMLAEKEVIKLDTQNFKFCIIRAPWFYGKYQPARQFEFFKMIKDGKVPLIGSGKNKRSMISVQSLAKAVWLSACNKKAENNIFWIADKNPYKMKDIIDTIRQVMDKDFHVITRAGYIKLPNFISEIAFYTDKLLQSLGLYNQKIHVLSEMNKNIHCSVSKAEKLIGFNPEISLRNSLLESIQEAIDKKAI
mgnify:FL=1|tara:strand:- start:147 stop:1190 length:1044 start_codon:yes stop_codon:yes gene_type:complete